MPSGAIGFFIMLVAVSVPAMLGLLTLSERDRDDNAAARRLGAMFSALWMAVAVAEFIVLYAILGGGAQ